MIDWAFKSRLMAQLFRPMVVLAVLALASGAGCSMHSRHHHSPGSGPVTYPLPSPSSPHPSDNWPVPPLDAEVVMQSCELDTRYDWPAGAGVTGAHKVALYSPTLKKQFLVKWKEVPRGFESWNNSPRREIAAYAIQKLFLDPEDFVVPPSVMRCAPLDEYRAVIDKGAKASLDGSNCVLGNLSLWLDNVTRGKPFYDPKRFATDANYALRMANFNLLTFIIDHKDGRASNFLVSKDDGDRRVFSVDNGISFDAWLFNYFVNNWDDLRVPALSKTAVDRLRKVRREQIEALGVLAELHLSDGGMLEPADFSPPIDKDKGVRTREGVIQFGLTADEVDDVREQIKEVIDGVDDGEIPVF